MIAHRRPWAHASNLRRNSHLSESDKSGFSPQIQKAHIAKQPSIDQRPHRSTDHRSTHPGRGPTTTQGQALSIHSRPSTSGPRSIDRRPTHPWRGLNNHPSIDSLRSERSRRHGSRLSTTPWLLDSANKLAKQVFRHPKMMLGGPVFVPKPF